MKKRMASAVRFLMRGKCANPGFVQQLAHISKLGLNSKIKQFSYSRAILPLRGENSFLSTVWCGNPEFVRNMLFIAF